MSQSYRLKLSRPSLKLRVASRIPARLAAESPILLDTTGGIYTFSLDINALQDSLDSIYAPVFMPSVVTLTSGTSYASDPSDDIILVETVPMDITVDWAARTKNLTVVDNTGTASVNPITITPAAGQTQLAQADYVYPINGNGGSVILRPLPDGTGAY